MEAADECDADSSPWLAKQLHQAKISWVGAFRNIAIADEDDFIERYGILTDSREKLSTMAHFWNGAFPSVHYSSMYDKRRTDNERLESENFLAQCFKILLLIQNSKSLKLTFAYS